MRYIILFLLSFSIFAKITVDIETVPQNPVMGETFNIIFKINTKDGDEPQIDFNPRGLEVLSKEQTGISTRTTYINGNLSVQRTISVTYEMIGSRSGTAYLRDILVSVGGKSVRHSNYKIKIHRELKKEKDIFVRAEVDKTEAFVGESIIVRYFLYNKVRVAAMDIKKFPSLDKFMKRFHQESMATQRVQLAGGIYERRIVYTAQLFSNDTGKKKVDSIQLAVQYPYGRSRNNLFSGFGLGSHNMRKRTLSSKPVEINIKALPNNPPAGFTGLVGDHTFDFKINKTKFLVNEPIEIDFVVNGQGALELYEKPDVFSSDLVEEFDDSADLVVNKDFTAQKTFKITYLARKNGLIQSKKIPVVYFDSKKLEFKTFYIDLSEIKIAGGNFSVPAKMNNQNKDVSVKPSVIYQKEKINPIVKLKNTFLYNQYLIYGITVFIFILIFRVETMTLLKNLKPEPKDEFIYKLSKVGMNYGDFYELVRKLGSGNDNYTIIEKSSLSKGSKLELLKLQKLFDDNYLSGKKNVLKITKKTSKDLKQVL
ncbi:MAG: BatD family protein [Bacteriovoracaceae bacterium]|nr:BatD family protein [Bacteriovoracaceae bacterium]